ncbi:MAG: hypothetical protein Q7R54_03450 [bacterium]|nr:hypothetical protein [bacterium]
MSEGPPKAPKPKIETDPEVAQAPVPEAQQGSVVEDFVARRTSEDLKRILFENQGVNLNKRLPPLQRNPMETDADYYGRREEWVKEREVADTEAHEMLGTLSDRLLDGSITDDQKAALGEYFAANKDFSRNRSADVWGPRWEGLWQNPEFLQMVGSQK